MSTAGGVTTAGVSTPVVTAITAFAATVVNLGLLFGWYHWTQPQIAGVNTVVVAGVAVVSALRARDQTAGRIVSTKGS